MNSKLVVQLSHSPLAGAPGRLTKSLNSHSSWKSICFIERDYKAEKEKLFASDCVDLQRCENVEGLSILDAALRSASVIHIHNHISPELTRIVASADINVPIIYHLHSPRREGPLYVPRTDDYGFPIARTLVVAQMHPRFYPDAVPVPNIVPNQPVPPLARADDKIRILYAPSEIRGGRWNGKACQELFDALDATTLLPNVEVVRPAGIMSSVTLELLRSMCDITIDEITTGGFHQISLEGLQAGNAVINGADEFSMQIMAGWTGELPPFIISNRMKIKEDLFSLLNDQKRLEGIKAASKKYAEKHLQPHTLVKHYEEIYDALQQ